MSNNESFLTDKPIGIIIPPPDIKKDIDKSAEFVARHGSSFEEMMKKENLPRFSYVNETDPYHPYYQSIVANYAKMLAKGTINFLKFEF